MFKGIKEAIWPAPPPASKPVIFDDQDGRPVARYCEYNQAKLSVLGNWYHFQSYGKILRSLEYSRIAQAFLDVIGIVFVFMLFPIAPFLRAYFTRRDAVNKLWIQLTGRAKQQMYAYDSCLNYEWFNSLEWVRLQPRSVESLTPGDQLEWLIANDKEGADFWRSEYESGTDLRPAIRDNLRDFGYGSQVGWIIISEEE